MKRQRRIVLLVATGLVGLVGAACDDSGTIESSESSPEATITKTGGETTGATTDMTTTATSPAADDTTPGDTSPAATGPVDTGPGDTGPADTGPPEGSTDTVYPSGDIDAGLQPFITMAIDDLAARLGIDAAEITTLSAVLVVWPNGAMGCPQPGMQYTQVPVDGSVIELGAGGRVYRYHTGGSRTPFLCDQPLTSKPPSGDIGG
jgi:hypothetical protein